MHILWPVSLINSTRPAKAHTVSDSSRKAAMERIYELIFLGNTNLKTSSAIIVFRIAIFVHGRGFCILSIISEQWIIKEAAAPEEEKG